MNIIKDNIKTFLETLNWEYDFSEEDNVFITGTTLENTKLPNLPIYIIFDETDACIYGELLLKADQSAIHSVAEFLHRANLGLQCGNFELNMDTGKIRYKVNISTIGKGELLFEEFKRALIVPVVMFERYGDSLVEVLYGFKTPSEAIKIAEK